ncbi:MAG: hypothetical protein ACK5M3_15390 [Dysgonomonas sp.]
MITKQKIEIYLKYQDADLLARSGSADEKSIMNEDWVLIDDLLHDIYLLKNNLVSFEMRSEIEKRIHQYTGNNKELAEELFNIK